MFMSGADYKLARKLKSIVDHQVEQLPAEDRLQIIRDKIKRIYTMHMRKVLEDIMSAPWSGSIPKIPNVKRLQEEY